MNRHWNGLVLQLVAAVLAVVGTSRNPCNLERKPNIIFILCDDVGWDDFGIHGNNQIPTPNIDAILTHGVAFDRYYSAPMCTPARSSLMTGKYASTIGMQHYVIANDQPYGLGLDHKTMPEYLLDLGYSTHMVGKWHLGFFREEYTPTYRGFQTFFGYEGGLVDYYQHTSDSINNGLNFTLGYDMRRNTTLAWDTQGQYATDLFTRIAVERIHNHNQNQPLFLYLSQLAAHAGNEALTKQAPEEEIEKFAFIKNPLRRAYAAVMSELDKSVGRVITALKETGMMENTVIVFAADNGSPVVGELHNAGSNYPFRGQKDSPWEGATRVLAGIYAPFLQASQRISTQLFHITDWLPTFVHLAGGSISDKTINGVNQWPSICQNLKGPRDELLLNIDQVEPGPYRSIIVQDWKLVKGSNFNGTYDTWLCDSVNPNNIESHPSFRFYGRSVLSSAVSKAIASVTCPAKFAELTPQKIETLRDELTVSCNNVPRQPCNPNLGPCLYNIRNDPCENLDLSKQQSRVLQRLQARLDYHERRVVAPRNKPDDPDSDPLFFNGTWAFWYDVLGIPKYSTPRYEVLDV